jgi:DNA invertase Pin-like site-specific DNA recombinase
MNAFYGYIRVSTVRQGEHGVSLPEQKDAIERYAARKGLKIIEWFEEQQTAAKQGRPVFNRMLRLLRSEKAAGVIIHKIDRGARNLKDWAALGELIDSGIAVHFTNEALDLNSTTGRLSADIQAVVAAHYIRNLRDETIKGFYGRLKQGIFPMPALLGYLDAGSGKTKVPDPDRAPLMKMAFELYATRQYGLKRLADKLFELGLRTKAGKKVTDSVLSRLLSNPFYMGVIRIQKTGDSYLGVHQPLISKDLFDCVQHILRGKYVSGPHRHQFLFRRLITCSSCHYSLVPERQKGHVYYRCQVPACPNKTIREEIIDTAFRSKFRALRLNGREISYMEKHFMHLERNWEQDRLCIIDALKLQIAASKERLNRLTDAYLSGDLEKELFQERKAALLMERRGIEDKLATVQQKDFSIPKQVREFLELAKTALNTYESAPFEERRHLLEKITSNRVSDCKNVDITLAFPFSEIANRFENQHGGPHRGRPRTLRELFGKL